MASFFTKAHWVCVSSLSVLLAFEKREKDENKYLTISQIPGTF